jgi:hypothetical protein
MDIPTHAELVAKIDSFLERHDMAPTRLGRDATGEPNLIPSIRAGRSPNLDTLNKLADLMAEHDARLTPADIAPSPDNGVENIGAGEADSRGPFAPTSPTCSPTSAPDSRACSAGGEAEEWPLRDQKARVA